MNDAMMGACTLSRWNGDARRCRWCDNELPKRRQRWCSDACADEAVQNHWWNAARAAALRAQGRRCQRCVPNPRPPYGRGIQVHHRDERAMGRHSATSCCHHVDGLEVICHEHHVDEHTTTATGRARRQRRANTRDQLRIGEEAR